MKIITFSSPEHGVKDVDAILKSYKCAQYSYSGIVWLAAMPDGFDHKVLTSIGFQSVIAMDYPSPPDNEAKAAKNDSGLEALCTDKNLLTYVNNWEVDEYYVNGTRIKALKSVVINGKEYPVMSKKITVPYSDMGHSYTSTSEHYFIDVVDSSIHTLTDLNEVIRNNKIYAKDFKWFSK